MRFHDPTDIAPRTLRSSRGFTLIEVLASGVLGAMLLTALAYALLPRAIAFSRNELLHSAATAFFLPIDERNERWEELQRHPDWHFGRPEFPDHDTLLAQRNRVIERHADTIFIGAHLGNYPENLAYVDACLERYPNFNVDTSARSGEIGRHPAEEARGFFLKHQDRVLFGTDLVLRSSATDDGMRKRHRERYDAHWQFFETDERQIFYPGYPIQGRWKVDAIGLPHAVLEKLYFRNAQRLIDLEPLSACPTVCCWSRGRSRRCTRQSSRIQRHA